MENPDGGEKEVSFPMVSMAGLKSNLSVQARKNECQQHKVVHWTIFSRYQTIPKTMKGEEQGKRVGILDFSWSYRKSLQLFSVDDDLGISLTMEVKDLHTENYKISMKEIKEHKKWEDVSYS